MSTSSVFSANWYRVSQLHPGLKPQVALTRHVYRDEIWYVLQDNGSGRQHRLNQHAYAIVGRMTGKATMQEIWQQAVNEFGDDAPSQPEVIELLAKLHQNELVRTEVTPNIAELFRTRADRSRKERNSKLNPFAFRVTLFDPDPLLTAMAPIARLLFKSWAVLLWLFAIGLALAGVATHWQELSSYSVSHLTTPRMILVMWLMYPVLKAVHELAHGLALKVWGGESHDFGVTLMLLMPVPYIDCSSASSFAEKHRRVAVSLIGIATELLFASVATGVWIYASNGLVREIAFALMVIGGVSTVLFNANPLMKFDGYHALSDWIEIPGMAARGQQLVDYHIKRRIFGSKEVQPPSHLGNERVWLLGYAMAAWCYKILVTFGVIAWLIGVSVALSVAAALWFVIALVILPLGKLGWYAWKSSEVKRSRLRAIGSFGLAVGALFALVFVAPIPSVTSAQGIVWLPEEARVRAATEGFVKKVLVQDGQLVAAGDVLLELEDPAVASEYEKLLARLEGLNSGYLAMLVKNASQAALIAEDVHRTQAEIARIEQRTEQLKVVSAGTGRLVWPQPQNLLGKFVLRGALVAHVVPNNQWQVRVVLAQNNVAQITQKTQGVMVRSAEHDSEPFAASLTTQTPSAVRELPSPILGDRAGGVFVTDPNDQNGVKTMDPVFVLDLKVPGKQLERLGERVFVRFDHGESTLASVWSRRVHQVFLKALGAERNVLAGI
jgi:putative peptide zinc metalloprotease protein